MLTRRSLLANAAAGMVVMESGSGWTQADPRSAWLNVNSSPVRSIDPNDLDFSDLMPLARAIGDARIVMLGEQTHGDGATFEAKGRLVKFLHRHMGFDVLAWEAPLYDVRKAWQALQAGEDVGLATAKSIFEFWSLSRQAKPVFDYVHANVRSDHPLELAGFDCQFNFYARESLLADLAGFLGARGVDTASMSAWPRFRDVFGRIIADSGRRCCNWQQSEDEHRFVVAMLEGLNARTASAQDPDARFWHQLLRSMKSQAQFHFRAPRPPAPFKVVDNNIRDGAMGDNLLWLAREAYPRRKIIVSAANLHNMRNPHLLSGEFKELVTMGHVAWRILGSQIYNLAFNSYEGEFGWAKGNPPSRLERPLPGSLEALWADTAHQVAFLNLRDPAPGGEWLHGPLASWVVRREDTITAEWPQIFDGLVFLRTMRPSTSIN